MGMILGIVGKIGMQMLFAALSKNVIESLMFGALDWLVKRTDTKVDDEAVAKIKANYFKEDEE